MNAPLPYFPKLPYEKSSYILIKSNDIVFHKQFYLDIETYKAIITILIKYSNYSFMTVEIFIYLLNQT